MTPENFTLLLFVLLFVSIPSFILLILVMHLLMPKVALERYWKEPHFRPFELAFYVRSCAPLRTVVLMWAFMLSGIARKRKMTDVQQVVPRWYRVGSTIFGVWVFTLLFGCLGILLGLTAHSFVLGDLKNEQAKSAALISVGLLIIFLAFWFERRRARRQNTDKKATSLQKQDNRRRSRQYR